MRRKIFRIKTETMSRSSQVLENFRKNCLFHLWWNVGEFNNVRVDIIKKRKTKMDLYVESQ